MNKLLTYFTGFDSLTDTSDIVGAFSESQTKIVKGCIECGVGAKEDLISTQTLNAQELLHMRMPPSNHSIEESVRFEMSRLTRQHLKGKTGNWRFVERRERPLSRQEAKSCFGMWVPKHAEKVAGFPMIVLFLPNAPRETEVVLEVLNCSIRKHAQYRYQIAINDVLNTMRAYPMEYTEEELLPFWLVNEPRKKVVERVKMRDAQVEKANKAPVFAGVTVGDHVEFYVALMKKSKFRRGRQSGVVTSIEYSRGCYEYPDVAISIRMDDGGDIVKWGQGHYT